MANGLIDRFAAELMRVNYEAQNGDRDARGLIHRRDGTGVDIYAHPSAVLHLQAAIAPFTPFRFEPPDKGPDGAVGKFMNRWIIADEQQPEGALFIWLDGKPYSSVLLDAPSPDPKP